MQKLLTQCISPCSQISPRKPNPTGMSLIAVKFRWYFRVTSLHKKSHTLKQYLHYCVCFLSSLPIWSPYFLQPWHSEWLPNSFPGILAFLDTQKDKKGVKHLSQQPEKTPLFTQSQNSQPKATPKPDPALSSALPLILPGLSWANPTPEPNRMQSSFSPGCVFCQVCKMNRLGEIGWAPHRVQGKQWTCKPSLKRKTTER